MVLTGKKKISNWVHSPNRNGAFFDRFQSCFNGSRQAARLFKWKGTSEGRKGLFFSQYFTNDRIDVWASLCAH